MKNKCIWGIFLEIFGIISVLVIVITIIVLMVNQSPPEVTIMMILIISGILLFIFFLFFGIALSIMREINAEEKKNKEEVSDFFDALPSSLEET
jgi:ATP/ADP translocase